MNTGSALKTSPNKLILGDLCPDSFCRGLVHVEVKMTYMALGAICTQYSRCCSFIQISQVWVDHLLTWVPRHSPRRWGLPMTPGSCPRWGAPRGGLWVLWQWAAQTQKMCQRVQRPPCWSCQIELLPPLHHSLALKHNINTSIFWCRGAVWSQENLCETHSLRTLLYSKQPQKWQHLLLCQQGLAIASSFPLNLRSVWFIPPLPYQWVGKNCRDLNLNSKDHSFKTMT